MNTTSLRHPLCHLSSACAVAALVLASACAEPGAPVDEHAGAALSAPGGDQCAAITNADLAALGDTIAAGLTLAEQDVAAFGVTGRYAEAAVGARDAFLAARGYLDAYRQELAESPYDGDPTVTDAWEGSHGGGYAWSISDQLQQAVHWGSVSAIYHRSELARAEVEEALRGLELAHELRARGQRCYVDAYFAP